MDCYSVNAKKSKEDGIMWCSCMAGVKKSDSVNLAIILLQMMKSEIAM